MSHRTVVEYWDAYNRLPAEVREHADRAFAMLKADPSHPSLKLEKVGRYWSVRVGLDHRALAVEFGEGFVWFWIGIHAEYDRFIR